MTSIPRRLQVALAGFLVLWPLFAEADFLVNFFAPRQVHGTFSHWNGGAQSLTLLISNGTGWELKLLEGTTSIDSRFRVSGLTPGAPYTFILRTRPFGGGAAYDSVVGTHTTRVSTVGGVLLFDTAILDESFESVHVNLNAYTLEFEGVSVTNECRAYGGGFVGRSASQFRGGLTLTDTSLSLTDCGVSNSLSLTAGGSLEVAINRCRAAGVSLTAGGSPATVSDLSADSLLLVGTDVALTDCRIRGSLAVSSPGGRSVTLTDCRGGALSVTGRSVTLTRCVSDGNLQALGGDVSAANCYVARAAGSALTATQSLSVTSCDFYDLGRWPIGWQSSGQVSVNGVAFTCPPSGLTVQNNVFLVNVGFVHPTLSGGEALNVAGNSFLGFGVLVRQSLDAFNGGSFQPCRVNGNYWGGYRGFRGPETIEYFWLDGLGAYIDDVSTNSTFLSTGAEAVSGLAAPTSPPPVWIAGHVAGQNVLAPGYTFAKRGRRTLLCYDLRTMYGTRTADAFTLRVGAETLHPLNPGMTIERDYGDPAETGVSSDRTLNFIIPARTNDVVSFELREEVAGQGSVLLHESSYSQQYGFARPLLLGVKPIIIDGWGYLAKFSADDAFTTVVNGKPAIVGSKGQIKMQATEGLKSSFQALLPLRWREELRITALGEERFVPRLLHRTPIIGPRTLLSSLSSRLRVAWMKENAARAGRGRPQIDRLLGMLPAGQINALVGGGATAFNYPSHPEVCVFEESDPVGVIHEFGHTFGFYRAPEQYAMPAGWVFPGGWGTLRYFVRPPNGARVWGMTMFLPEEGLAFKLVEGGLRHFPMGSEENVFDIMGGEWSGGIIPYTHQSFANALYGLLGVETGAVAGASSPAASRAAPRAAAGGGTHRVLIEGVAVARPDRDVPGVANYSVAPETLVCSLAPAGMGTMGGGLEMTTYLEACDAAGATVLRSVCTSPYGLGEESFDWAQTFDVPDTAVHMALRDTGAGYQFEVPPCSGPWGVQMQAAAGSDMQLTGGVEFVVQRTGVPSVGRGLATTVSCSTNGGVTWDRLGQCDDTERFRVQGDGFEPANDVRFKAILSDGFTNRESAVLGPYSRPAIPPRVAILSPWPGATAPTGTAWTLEALVSTPEDEAGVVWRSSLAGPLGTGLRLTNVVLAAGAHAITCVAADGQGLTGTGHIDLVVGDGTRADLRVEDSALRISVPGTDPITGQASRPQIGAVCRATVTVFNPGAACTGRVTLSYQPPVGGAQTLADEVFFWRPLESRSVNGLFMPAKQGVHRFEARAALLGPAAPVDTNADNNIGVWVFTNEAPAAVGGTAEGFAGRPLDLLLPGFDPDGDAFTITVTRMPTGGTLVATTSNFVYAAAESFAGQDTFQYRAFDGSLWSTDALCRVRVLPAMPTVPWSMSVTAMTARALWYRIPATGQGLTYTASSVLHAFFPELTLDPVTGVLSGVPRGAFAPVGIPITVRNAGGSGLGTLWLTIVENPYPPEFQGPLSATGTVGVAFGYAIGALNGVVRYWAQNLPPGLSVNENTGSIYGTPGASGYYEVTIGASNLNGRSSATLPLRVLQSDQPPRFVTVLNRSCAIGEAFELRVADCVAGEPFRFTVICLPSGFVMDGRTGVISGRAVRSGQYGVTVKAYNVVGQAEQHFTLEVTRMPGAPVVNNPGGLGGDVGQEYSYQIEATGSPTNYTSLGLPPGLAVNPATGLISGTPTAAGVFWLEITAANAAGQDGIRISMSVWPPYGVPWSPWAITSPSSASGVLGGAFGYTIEAMSDPVTFGAVGLPAALTVNPATGLITGRLERVGRFDATISAGNSYGTTSAVLRITVAPDYAGWALLRGLSGADALSDADPDGNGMPNLAEYAFNVAAGSRAAPVRLEPQGADLWLRHRLWPGGSGNLLGEYSGGGVEYGLEFVDALGQTWTTDPNRFDVRIEWQENADGTVSFGTRLQPVPAWSGFFRVRLRKQ